MRVNHNLSSIKALNNLYQTAGGLDKSLEKLSSGLRIVTASDDASGLAISEGMRSQVNGLSAARLNAQEGVSVLQTAEGALNTVHNILQRINTLSVRAANDATLSSENKSLMQSEVAQLTAELDRIAETVSFNGKSLLDGSFTSQNLQVAEKSGGANVFSLNIGSVSSSALGLSGVNIAAAGGASSAITITNSAITTVSNNRGTIGAAMNRLNYTIDNINTAVQNVTASESRIRDVDMAAEISNFQRLQVLNQAGTSMLAQANARPQSVLSLL